MSSPNLGISHVVAAQNQKEVTINGAIDALDEALTDLLVVPMADANQTPSSANALAHVAITCTGALTAGRNLVVPAIKKFYLVNNATTGGFSITVKTSGGTGIAVAPGTTYSALYCDGTNVVQLAATSAGGSFTGLSDAPGSYSTHGGQAVEVNSGATALQFSAKPFDVSVFAPGVGTNSQKLARLPLARAVTFLASATLSQAKASAAATGSTTFTLKKNGSSFATVNFAASASSGTWTQASDSVFAAGDVLEIDGPGTADATLADVGITLAGVRA